MSTKSLVLTIAKAAELYRKIIDPFNGHVPFELTHINAVNRVALKPANDLYVETLTALENELIDGQVAVRFGNLLMPGVTIGEDGQPNKGKDGQPVQDLQKVEVFKKRFSDFDAEMGDADKSEAYQLRAYPAAKLESVNVVTDFTNSLIEYELLAV
jgi:hypothetical protein